MSDMARLRGRKHWSGLSAETGGRFEPITMQPVDEARWVSGPPGFRFYGQEQYDAYAGEQLRLYEAEGEKKARRPALVAAANLTPAGRVLRAIETQTDRVKAAAARADEIEGALSLYVRRARFEKARYYATTCLLLGGDVAGVGGAAISLGEDPLLALTQAFASGTAAITAGLVGQEVRDSRRARKHARDPKEMPVELRKYEHLFRGGDTGESIVKVLAGGALTIALVIACSILALRASTEGTLAGVVFGGLATAISLASFLNVYTHTDDVADLIDNAKHAHRIEERKLARLTRNRSLRRNQKALDEIASIENEYQLRGEAAALNVTASKYAQLSQHPGVAGHGHTTPAAAPTGAENRKRVSQNHNGGADARRRRL